MCAEPDRTFFDSAAARRRRPWRINGRVTCSLGSGSHSEGTWLCAIFFESIITRAAGLSRRSVAEFWSPASRSPRPGSPRAAAVEEAAEGAEAAELVEGARAAVELAAAEQAAAELAEGARVAARAPAERLIV
jgi:hypothetical protein